MRDPRSAPEGASSTRPPTVIRSGLIASAVPVRTAANVATPPTGRLGAT
jgi:hypothetical protein